MRTIRLTLEYDGTDFVGWQRQARGRSVQAEVERAVAAVTAAPARAVAAGRTDAGVHAVGQVAHFHTASAAAPDLLRRALNAVLPPDISVREVAEAPPGFHARRDARLRVYRYVILHRPVPAPLLRRYTHHVRGPLDLGAMGEALAHLQGAHDFRAFRGLGGPTRHTRCALLVADLAERGDFLVLTFAADRFLRRMVRMIVGTVLRVGRGTLRSADVPDLRDHGGDGAAGPAAPPQGLYLVHVGYGERPPGPAGADAIMGAGP